MTNYKKSWGLDTYLTRISHEFFAVYSFVPIRVKIKRSLLDNFAPHFLFLAQRKTRGLLLISTTTTFG